jgi:perosamine synthetase
MSRYRMEMSKPDIQPEDIEHVTRVLQSGQLSLGPYVQAFESAFADYVGARHAVAVSSGTAGLHLCMHAAGIGEGDEVITSPFSFVASVNCALYEQATPVFVDIDPVSMTMDPRLVAAAVTARTRIVLPVHVYGQPCAMDEISAVCREHRLLLIEDACEAVGAEYRGRRIGAIGKATVFAFYPNKQMTTGEGGMITTDDAEWAARLRSLRNQGRDDGRTWLNHVRLGFNYRLNEMSSALGLSQLRRLDQLLAMRDEVAQCYGQLLKTVPGVSCLQVVPSTTRLSWFVYVVRFDPGIDRDQVIDCLEQDGIPSRVYFRPVHLQPYLTRRFGYKPGDFPVTERIADSVLALPFHANMPVDDVEQVVAALRKAVTIARRPAAPAMAAQSQ